MTEVIPGAAFAAAQAPSVLMSVLTAQPLACAIIAFFLLCTLLTAALRLADWVEPPERRQRRSRLDGASPKLWRFRRPA
ncbi:hypothetical protein [Azospirillum sp.]|uniref:hypothetical protein n=1 Tax=Azospirillum sp. TaxID=34012 RepID=UPI002618F86F|nr:hypothetical protein [Azospirillum sp.]